MDHFNEIIIIDHMLIIFMKNGKRKWCDVMKNPCFFSDAWAEIPCHVIIYLFILPFFDFHFSPRFSLFFPWAENKLFSFYDCFFIISHPYDAQEVVWLKTYYRRSSDQLLKIHKWKNTSNYFISNVVWICRRLFSARSPFCDNSNLGSINNFFPWKS